MGRAGEKPSGRSVIRSPRRVSPDRLRLIVITDARRAAPRDLLWVVEEALRGGAPAVQLREKGAAVRDLVPLAGRLRALTHEHGALFFVNDRLDLALAAGADGVHLGPDDLPPSAVRPVAPKELLIGFSADDAGIARAAIEAGADYIGCGTVWPTSSKEDAGGAIGLNGLRRVVRAARGPVVAIGGMTVDRAARVRATGAAGVAVMSAVMSAPEPAETVRRLLESVDGAGGPERGPYMNDSSLPAEP